jgi:hypothetical protein
MTLDTTMDISFLLPLLYAGAGVATTTVVQETTKSVGCVAAGALHIRGKP